MRPISLLSVALALGAASIQGHASCSAAFCSLNTGLEAQELGASEGALFDLRYERILQNQPRSGDSRLAADDEVETVNDNWVATVDYAFDDKWGANLRLPFLAREHTHNSGVGTSDERWDLSGLGDVQAIARYSLRRHMFGGGGIRFGLKLPTGAFEERNDAGDVAERSLQLGSGTTDVILGGYYSRAIVPNQSSGFGQLSVQVPLAQRDGYRPGSQIGADVGARYAVSANTAALAQINLQYKWHDVGAEAEPNSSGGGFVFFSPGISYSLAREWQVYAYAQLPLYQYVKGIQLTAEWAAVVGLTRRF